MALVRVCYTLMFLYDILLASGTQESMSTPVRRMLEYYSDLLSPYTRKRIIRTYPKVLKHITGLNNLSFPQFKLLLTDVLALFQAEAEQAGLKHREITDVITGVASLDIELVSDSEQEQVYAITNNFKQQLSRFLS